MGKSELVFTMTQVEHKAAVKVDKSPDGPRVVVQLRVQGAWPRPIRVRAQPLLCKLGGLRLAGARAWPRRFYPMGGRGRVNPCQQPTTHNFTRRMPNQQRRSTDGKRETTK